MSTPKICSQIVIYLVSFIGSVARLRYPSLPVVRFSISNPVISVYSNASFFHPFDVSPAIYPLIQYNYHIYQAFLPAVQQKDPHSHNLFIPTQDGVI